MGEGLKRAFAAAARETVTPRQKQVLEALTDDLAGPREIAVRAGIHTMSRGETASRYNVRSRRQWKHVP